MKNIMLCLLMLSVNIGYSQDPFIDKKDESNYLFVEVKIKGEKMKFLFDNGFSHTAILAKYFKEAESEGIDATDSFYNKEEMRFTKKYHALKLTSAKMKYKLRFLLLNDIPEYFKLNNIVGVMGNDIISMYDWVLDFENNNAYIYKPKKEDSTPFKLKIDKFENDSIALELNNAENKNSIFVPCKLDLGFSGVFSYSDATKIDGDEKVLHRLTTSSTVIESNAIVEETIFTREMKFNNFSISNVPVMESERNKKSLLGVTFLSKFKKCILYNSKSQIWLKENNDISFYYSSPRLFNNKIWSKISETKWDANSIERANLGSIVEENQYQVKSYVWRSKVVID